MTPKVSRLVTVLAVLASGWISAPLSSQEDLGTQNLDDLRANAEQIRGAEACGECHFLEYEEWKSTTHATGFKTLHRKDNAEKIASQMGFRLIKRESLCIRCHYTPATSGDRLRALSGVSCESCHGPGRGWIDIHNDYGGGADYASESAEHKEQRIAASVAAGMRRPSLLYDVAKSCFGCHIVPEEQLVNEGGHGSGSGGFELVDWSDQIRHNFLGSLRGGDSTNAERSEAAKRMMFIVGRVAELESVLRAVAKAEAGGPYLKAMQQRARRVVGDLRDMTDLADLPEVNELLKLMRGADLELGNAPTLVSTADRFSPVVERLLETHDGSQLAALDELRFGTDGLEGQSEVATQVAEGGALGSDRGDGNAGGAVDQPVTTGSRAEAETSGSAAETTETGATSPSDEPGATAPRPSSTSAARTTDSRPGPRGPLGPARSSHRTLGTECASCHNPQNNWLFEDAHFASADPFVDEAQANVQIARLYGIDPDDMSRGRQVCMRCHGTVISGRENRRVQDGVGCESCHGAAGDFLEPHKEGDKGLGLNRPGYVNALRLGMTELKDLDTRARVCTDCHYITDGRLISTGHPSGADFDYLGAMAKIQHWDHGLAPGPRLATAFEGASRKRGGVPAVRVSQGASESSGTSPGSTSPGGRGEALSAGGSATAGAFVNSGVLAPRPLGTVSEASGTQAAPSPGSASPNLAAGVAVAAPPPPRPVRALSAFPEIGADTSIEDILQRVKEKLEELHRSSRRGGRLD